MVPAPERRQTRATEGAHGYHHGPRGRPQGAGCQSAAGGAPAQAAAIVTVERIIDTGADFLVESTAEPDRRYRVSAGCDCGDLERDPCRHEVALALQSAYERHEARCRAATGVVG